MPSYLRFRVDRLLVKSSLHAGDRLRRRFGGVGQALQQPWEWTQRRGAAGARIQTEARPTRDCRQEGLAKMSRANAIAICRLSTGVVLAALLIAGGALAQMDERPSPEEAPPVVQPTEPPAPPVYSLPAPPEASHAERYKALPRFGANLFARATPVERGGLLPGGAAGASAAGEAAQPSVAPTTVTVQVPGAVGAQPVPGQPVAVSAGTSVAPAAVSAGAPVVNAPVPPGYVIGPGDVLRLTVIAKERTQIDRDYAVTAEGFIFLPQIGRITAAGQRIADLQGTVSEAYRQYYVDPQVTLVVSQQRVVEVYVTGEAQQPGKYVLTGMATVFSALYAAGGPSAIGSYRNLKLTRVGKPTLTIDLYDYLLEGKRDQDVMLEPGDTLFIPPLEAEVGLAGEVRRQARYEMKGATTVEQALAMAGGLMPTGYAPRVKLWRMDERREWQLTDLDLSQPGGKDGATVLRDGDLLEVPSALVEPMNVAYVLGAVRRPGAYPATAGMTVGGLIAAAQGPGVEAYLEAGVVRRLNEKRSYDTLRFSLAEILAGKPGADLALQPGDIVQVYWRREVEPAHQVEVYGAVARPGVYDWVAKMRVSQLILLAGGVLPGAYVEEAKLERVRPDQRRELLTVDVAAALAGEEESDLVLERGDILRVKTRAEALPPSMVQIRGYVRNPGEYPRLEGMRVSSLIYAAGGLLPEAGPTVELTPGRYLGEPVSMTLKLIGTPDNFRLDPDPVLKDDDSVGVASRGDFVARAAMATLAGEVQRPGTYAIKGLPGKEQYTVWDLLQEGGALLPDANPRGMVLYRAQAWQSKAQGDDLGKVLRAVNTEARESEGPVGAPGAVGTPQQSAALSQAVAQGITSVLAGTGRVTIILPPQPVSAEHAVTGIPLDGEKLLASKGREGNVVLQDGDVVVVPKHPTTVTVLGAVARPGAIPAAGALKVHEYLTLAGGLREDAAGDRIVVVHANGGAAPAKASTEILPGDVVVIPTRHVVRNIRTQSELMTWLQGIVPVITAALVLR